MKKILLIVAAIALIIPMTVGASFAADVTVAASDNTKDLATDGGIPDCEVSFSKNVSAYYAGLAQEYAVTTAHTSGNKIYGSHSASTLIFWLDNPPGNPATSASSTTIDGWTAM
jgi:hypothetical protein